jgi:hypothetical protein
VWVVLSKVEAHGARLEVSGSTTTRYCPALVAIAADTELVLGPLCSEIRVFSRVIEYAKWGLEVFVFSRQAGRYRGGSCQSPAAYHCSEKYKQGLHVGIAVNQYDEPPISELM